MSENCVQITRQHTMHTYEKVAIIERNRVQNGHKHIKKRKDSEAEGYVQISTYNND